MMRNWPRHYLLRLSVAELCMVEEGLSASLDRCDQATWEHRLGLLRQVERLRHYAEELDPQ